MTLLRQIQCLLERTYAPTGINLEDYLIHKSRSDDLALLAGERACSLSMRGRVYLRRTGESLRLAVYFSPETIDHLEQNHPLQTLGDNNIRDFITFIEEINHALHAILLFLGGQKEITSESFLCNLELQGKIDTYLILKHCICRAHQQRTLLPRQKRWLTEWLFKRETFDYPDKQMAQRYREANHIGYHFVRKIDKRKPDERIEIIRRLRPLPYQQKKEFILAV